MAARGVDLLTLFKHINSEEREHAITIDVFTALPEDFHYTEYIVDQLDIVAELCPGLDALYNTQEDWPTTVYLLKHMTRAKYAREQFEEIQFLLGDGKNGKGFFMFLLRQLFGSDGYYCQPKTGIFTSKSSCNSASPDLMELLGKRIACIPEVEDKANLVVSTLKDYRDQTTVITARLLFKGNKKFCPQFMLVLSANKKFLFSSIDGGTIRSFTCILWPFKFTDSPKPDTMQRRAENVKDPDFVSQARPTFDMLMRAIDTVFYCDRATRETVVSPRPAAVQAASQQLMASVDGSANVEPRTLVERFCNDCITYKTTDASKHCTTGPQVYKIFEQHSKITRQQAEDFLKDFLVPVTVGGRSLLKRKDSGKSLMQPSRYAHAELPVILVPGE